MTGARPSPEGERKHIEINLGLACNNRCVFCLAGGAGGAVPFEQALKEASEHAAAGYDSIGFIGGEPTIYPRIAELGRECAAMGYRRIHIISNGRRLADGAFLDSLIAAGFTRFSVSIHSHVPEVEDELTGIPGGFAEKMSALKNLMDRGARGALKQKPCLNVLMTSRNIAELDKTLSLFGNMGFTEIRLLTVRPENRALENFDVVVPRLTEIRRRLPAVMPVARRYGMNIKMEASPYCVFHDVPGISRLIARDHIDQVIHYDKNEDREQFSWRERRVSCNRAKADFCARCAFDSVCEGVWRGYAERVGFDELHAVEKPAASLRPPRGNTQE